MAKWYSLNARGPLDHWLDGTLYSNGIYAPDSKLYCHLLFPLSIQMFCVGRYNRSVALKGLEHPLEFENQGLAPPANAFTPLIFPELFTKFTFWYLRKARFVLNLWLLFK